MRRMLRVLSAGLAVCLAGCQSYEPRPLVPAEVLRLVEESRDLLDETDAVRPDRESSATPPATDTDPRGEPGFVQAARWMCTRGPRLKEARAELAKARALAGTATPLPNPELVVGALYGTDLTDRIRSALQPLVEFGFTIPISGRLSRQDDVHAARAREAEIKLVVAHRREYLHLRRLYAAWILNHRQEEVQNKLLESAERSLELTRRLMTAGGATVLDLGLREIEVAERKLAILQIRAGRAQIVEALAERVGVHTRHFRRPARDSVLRSVPDLPELGRAKEILVANHPDLVELRARYEVADRELRLEIARQYPDITLGGSYEGDPGESRKVWGLALGVPIPVFDRNQQGIVVAREERERIRAAYEAMLSRALAALEGAYAQHEIAVRQRELIESAIVSKSEANLEIAAKLIEAGTFDSIKFLVVEQTLRTALVERLAAEREVERILGEVERILGVPLGRFPGEADDDYPYVPERIAAPADPGESDPPSPPRKEAKP